MRRNYTNNIGEHQLANKMARITYSLGVHLLWIMESSTLRLGKLEEVLRSFAVINVNYYYFLCGKVDTKNTDSCFFKRNQLPPIFFISKRRQIRKEDDV